MELSMVHLEPNLVAVENIVNDIKSPWCVNTDTTDLFYINVLCKRLTMYSLKGLKEIIQMAPWHVGAHGTHPGGQLDTLL